MTIRNFDKLLAPRSVALIGASPRPGSVGAVLTRNLVAGRVPVELVNPRRPDGWPATGDPLRLRIAYRAVPRSATPWFTVSVDDPYGTLLLELRSPARGADVIDTLHARGCAELEIAALPLAGGRYSLSLGCGHGREPAVWLDDLAEFHVWPVDVYDSGVPIEQPHGLLVTPHRWRHGPATP